MPADPFVLQSTIAELVQFSLPFLCLPKAKEAKERAPSTWPSASLAARLSAAVSANSSQRVGPQTVRNLHPHPTVALGCVERDQKHFSMALIMNTETWYACAYL